MASGGKGPLDCRQSAIQGYEMKDWVRETQISEFDQQTKEYHNKLCQDFALILTTCKGSSLRHLRGLFETHIGPVDLERLGMDNWRKLLISMRTMAQFKKNGMTGEMFVYASESATYECPTHMQQVIIATPNAPGEPKKDQLTPISCRDAFLAGDLDIVDGSVVDPRVPNQSAQVATKEDIEAKIHPLPPPRNAKCYSRGKMSFEEQIAPKLKREMITAEALGPTEVSSDPDVATSNLDKLIARALEEETERGEDASEGAGPSVNAVTCLRQVGGSECGSGGSSSSRRRGKTVKEFTPVNEVQRPSTFHRRFKPTLTATAVPFKSEEERLAARNAVGLRPTDYELQFRKQQEEEEANRRRLEREQEMRERAEREEREAGLRHAEELLQRQRQEEERVRIEEQQRLARQEQQQRLEEQQQRLARQEQHRLARQEQQQRLEEQQQLQQRLEEQQQRLARQEQQRLARDEQQQQQQRLEEQQQQRLEEQQQQQRLARDEQQRLQGEEEERLRREEERRLGREMDAMLERIAFLELERESDVVSHIVENVESGVEVAERAPNSVGFGRGRGRGIIPEASSVGGDEESREGVGRGRGRLGSRARGFMG